jgi:hypothetical protein
MNANGSQIMESRPAVRLKVYVPLLALVLSLIGVGCGQGDYMTPPPPAPPPISTLSSMQGSWELIFRSEFSNVIKVLEVNLSQTGTHVFAGASNSLVYESSNPNTPRLASFGGECDSGTVGDVTVDGTLSNQGATVENVSLTFTETGVLGSVVTTATALTNGTSISNGTYTIRPACGFPEDLGTFTGYQESGPFASSDVYSGTLNSGADVITAHFTSTPNSFDLTMSGTDNGGQFVLTGSVVGFSVSLTGNVAGKAVNWFGLYDPTYNTFEIYDSNAQHVGSLHEGANAQSAIQVSLLKIR